jgi:hypothetical protein
MTRLALEVELPCSRAMVKENLIENELAENPFVESVLLELEVKVVNPCVIRLFMLFMKLFEVGMS